MMANPNYCAALIVPVYNEEDAVGIFIKAIEEKLSALKGHLHIVFVNDGSTDRTGQIIEDLINAQNTLFPVSLIGLSRNFGKEAAMSAALDLVDDDALIPIDVDLQDPPELVLEFIRIWQEEGADTVYGVRADRSSDDEIKRVTSGGFYYVFNKLSSKVKIPQNVGDFRLIDRKVVLAVRQLRESNRFMKGLFAWPGFKSKGVSYQRPPRSAGSSKWNYWRLWNFALDGIISFSSLPLRIWSYIGAGVGGLALIYMFFIIIKTIITGGDVPGYASLMCVILFLGAVQLVSIGVIGEYLGRMSEEVKRRPVYVAASVQGLLGRSLPCGVHQTLNGMYVNGSDPAKEGAQKDPGRGQEAGAGEEA